MGGCSSCGNHRRRGNRQTDWARAASLCSPVRYLQSSTLFSSFFFSSYTSQSVRFVCFLARLLSVISSLTSLVYLIVCFRLCLFRFIMFHLVFLPYQTGRRLFSSKLIEQKLCFTLVLSAFRSKFPHVSGTQEVVTAVLSQHTNSNPQFTLDASAFCQS